MKNLPAVLAGLVTLAFAALCAAFVRQPTLATFADDSVSYLVMAQVFSPWQGAAPAVSAVFPLEAVYPPLFPLVLALAGAAHDVAWAHVLTALILAASLPVTYLLGLRWLGTAGGAVAAVLATALLPAMWINAKGILSEPLFCLLLLATLLAIESKRRPWVVALLMAGLLLTRAAALAPIAAYAAWSLTRREPRSGSRPISARLALALPAAIAVVAYGAWMLLRPAATADSYARILADNATALGGAADPWAVIQASLGRQLNAISEGWLGSLLVFWVEGRPVRTLLASAVGLAALAGLVLRLRDGKADAWMITAYLLMFLVWPFYDQMGRFLFPALPALVLYACVAAGRAVEAARRPALLGQALVALLVASLALPALAFIHQRTSQGGAAAAITDWYRTPGLREAQARTQVHLDLLADMAAIRTLTRAEDRVMWVVPGYIALLADRSSVKAPEASLGTDAYLTAVRKSGANYVFLSRYNPRDTLNEAAWEAGMRALAFDAKPLYAQGRPDGTVTSLLIKAPR